MSYRIPATNNYFGLEAVSAGPNSNFQTNLYLVSSSEATAINVNDLVVQTSKDTAKSVAGLTGTFVGTSSVGILGVAASPLAANAGSTAAELLLNTSQMVLLYDDLLQVYSITESSSGVIGPQTGLYKNYGLLASGVIGSTGPFQFGNAFRSNMALSGVESSVTGVLQDRKSTRLNS